MSHKYRCANEKDKKHNLKIYKAIRANEGWENWCIVEIEKYPCKDVFEARAREQYYYEQLHSSLNMIFPQRNRKEYREMNKEKITEYNRNYELCNKEFRNRLFVCECGVERSYNNKALHLKSKIHNDLMLSKNETPVSG
jgi:hypothetical protein